MQHLNEERGDDCLLECLQAGEGALTRSVNTSTACRKTHSCVISIRLSGLDQHFRSVDGSLDQFSVF